MKRNSRAQLLTINADMTFLYVFLLLLSGLMGLYSAVTDIPVKVGDLISVPCLYPPHYIHHVKYLCKGSPWRFCSPVARTDGPSIPERFSISDDPIGHVFTVTINNLEEDDTSFWCAVEIPGIQLDVKWHIQLLPTNSMPSLYVDKQEFIGFEGGSVTITCHCSHYEQIMWCKLGSSCATSHSESIDGTSVTINKTTPGGFSVTMSGLKLGSSGWYWCARDNQQMPVHIIVREPATSTTTTTKSTSTLLHSSSFASANTPTAQPVNSTTAGGGGESLHDQNQSRFTEPIIAIIALIVLLLIVVAAVFGWRMSRRNKAKLEGPHITVVSQRRSEPDVLYSTVVKNQHAAAPEKIETDNESVTYSTFVIRDGHSKRLNQQECVTYSIVCPH